MILIRYNSVIFYNCDQCYKRCPPELLDLFYFNRFALNWQFILRTQLNSNSLIDKISGQENILDVYLTLPKIIIYY